MEDPAPHPIRMLSDWTIEQNGIVHTRLNYWIVTEGLLLAAFAAADNLGVPTWQVRFSLAFSGVLFTLAWHSLYMRSWFWFAHFTTSLGKATATFLPGEDGGARTAFLPGKTEFGFWKAKGVSSRLAAHFLLLVFYGIWAFLVVISWQAADGSFFDTIVPGLGGILVFTFLVAPAILASGLVIGDEIRRWLQSRT